MFKYKGCRNYVLSIFTGGTTQKGFASKSSYDLYILIFLTLQKENVWSHWNLKLFWIRKGPSIINEMDYLMMSPIVGNHFRESQWQLRTSVPSGSSAVSLEDWVARDILMTITARWCNALKRECHTLQSVQHPPKNVLPIS